MCKEELIKYWLHSFHICFVIRSFLKEFFFPYLFENQFTPLLVYWVPSSFFNDHFQSRQVVKEFHEKVFNYWCRHFLFSLIGGKTLNELRAIVSTPHLKMKFPTLMGEIVTVKVDQKQSQQCYVESLKVAPYPSVRESGKPHSPSGGSNSQVISIVKEFPIRTLTVYEATMGNPSDTFDVDPRDNVIDKGPKPIEELVKL